MTTANVATHAKLRVDFTDAKGNRWHWLAVSRRPVVERRAMMAAKAHELRDRVAVTFEVRDGSR